MRFEVDGETVYAYTGTRDLVAAQPTVVFVHGGGLDHTVWTLQSRYLAHHGCNVLALDLPGHGASGGAPLESIASMADWTGRALDALGIERAALVGHSMGSLVTLEAAARLGDRAWLLVLLGTSTPMPVSDPLLDAAAGDRHDAFDMITLWGHGGPAQIGGCESPGMWMTGSSVRLLERARPGVLHNDLRACNEYTSGLESAARVRCPVLAILGRLDAMSPVRAARGLLEALPHPQVVELDGCGHMLMAERPGEVLDALAAAVSTAAP